MLSGPGKEREQDLKCLLLSSSAKPPVPAGHTQLLVRALDKVSANTWKAGETKCQKWDTDQNRTQAKVKHFQRCFGVKNSFMSLPSKHCVSFQREIMGQNKSFIELFPSSLSTVTLCPPGDRNAAEGSLCSTSPASPAEPCLLSSGGETQHLSEILNPERTIQTSAPQIGMAI